MVWRFLSRIHKLGHLWSYVHQFWLLLSKKLGKYCSTIVEQIKSIHRGRRPFRTTSLRPSMGAMFRDKNMDFGLFRQFSSCVYHPWIHSTFHNGFVWTWVILVLRSCRFISVCGWWCMEKLDSLAEKLVLPDTVPSR